MPKVSKEVARYSRGMASAHCGICKHFRAPDACAIVEGKISPSMWCKFFGLKAAAKGKR